MNEQAGAPDFWNDQAKAQALLRQRSDVEQKLDMIQKLDKELADADGYFELAVAENDSAAIADAESQIVGLEAKLRQAELARMLSGPVDHANAIVSINAGEGGT